MANLYQHYYECTHCGEAYYEFHNDDTLFCDPCPHCGNEQNDAGEILDLGTQDDYS